MKYQHNGYSLLLSRKDGTQHFALGNNGYFVAFNRKDAVKFKRELKPHLPRTAMKVVKVRVTIEEITKGPTP